MNRLLEQIRQLLSDPDRVVFYAILALIGFAIAQGWMFHTATAQSALQSATEVSASNAAEPSGTAAAAPHWEIYQRTTKPCREVWL